jgi:uncharacterized protein (DUF1684 family)
MPNAAAVLFLLLASPAPATTPSYEADLLAWRAQRQARLEADGGWLTVAGLFWLKEGDNRFGSDASNDIVLPSSVPAHAGTLSLQSGEVRFTLAEGVSGTVADAPVTGGVLRPDTSVSPDVLSLGRVTLQTIDRGGRLGIRMKDMDSARRKAFRGLHWFPVNEAYRVVARLVPAPGMISITNVLGQVSEMPRPGHLVFTLNGRELSLDPVLEEPDATSLFIMFRDKTAPKETYGAGRFLYVDLPKDGQVVLDFNKAYSPPCAFTAYATCPLPPKQNVLPVRIEAGEMKPEEPAAP